MISLLRNIIAFYLAIFMLNVNAHEFWLQPNTFSAAEGEKVQVNWRQGEKFQGQTLVYIPEMSSYVGIFQKGQRSKLMPRFAAKPTLNFNTGPDTTIGITESADFMVEYENFDAFLEFIKKENLGDQFVAPKNPPSGITFESYRRYAKTLISNQTQTWQDSLVGLKLEWLLTRDGNNLRGTLFIGGKPAVNYPVKLFAKPSQDSSDVSLQKTNTDTNGEVLFTNLDNGYLYLINAIKLRPSVEGDRFDKAQWHSDWASTTFQW
jgi:uncharacterized GH25 family protein